MHSILPQTFLIEFSHFFIVMERLCSLTLISMSLLPTTQALLNKFSGRAVLRVSLFVGISYISLTCYLYTTVIMYFNRAYSPACPPLWKGEGSLHCFQGVATSCLRLLTQISMEPPGSSTLDACPPTLAYSRLTSLSGFFEVVVELLVQVLVQAEDL